MPSSLGFSSRLVLLAPVSLAWGPSLWLGLPEGGGPRYEAERSESRRSVEGLGAGLGGQVGPS